MSNKQAKSNVKTKENKSNRSIIIGGFVSLGIIIISVGLGVGLTLGNTSSNSSTTNTTTTTDPDPDKNRGTETNNESKEPVVLTTTRNNYKLIEATKENTKEVIVRLDEKTTFDQIKSEVKSIKEDLQNKTITELRLPYGTRSDFQKAPDADGKTKIDLEKIKNELGIEIEEDKVGFIFYPSDETDVNKTYQRQNLVEVVLPKNQEIIVHNKFTWNKIRKVNFEDLINLREIKYQSFNTNKIESVDFSNSYALTKIESQAFGGNSITGTLVVPPKLKLLDNFAFWSNKIDKLDLTNAKSLITIGQRTFLDNNIKELDISTAPNLTEIGISAFAGNNIEKLNLNSNSLKSVGRDTFTDNKIKDTEKLTDPLSEGFIFNKELDSIWGEVFFRPYTTGETKKAVFVPKQITELQYYDKDSKKGSFSEGYAVYKAEVDLSIPKFKVEVIDGKNTLTFDSDTTIGDVIIRQDLIKAENAKKKIDKFVFPSTSITKFGDGEEFSKTSKRLLDLKKYLGLSDAVDAWVAATTNP